MVKRKTGIEMMKQERLYGSVVIVEDREEGEEGSDLSFESTKSPSNSLTH